VKCNDSDTYAHEYVFELLEEEDRKQYSKHIESCETCRERTKQAFDDREMLASWNITVPSGAAERSISRIYSKEIRQKSALNSLVVRIMAAAAVILAAIVLPRLFLMEKQAVLAYEAHSTTVEGVFNDFVKQELHVPVNCTKTAYVIVRVKSLDGKAPVKAAMRLNESESSILLTTAAEPEEEYILTNENGLKEGINLLTIENHGSIPLEFEVILMVGSSM